MPKHREENRQQDLESQLIAKAWQDPAFKQTLINDPKGTIEKETGMKIPDGVEIQVHEETADTLHLVLPPKPEEGELSEEELELAAGGSETVAGGQRFPIPLPRAPISMALIRGGHDPKIPANQAE